MEHGDNALAKFLPRLGETYLFSHTVKKTHAKFLFQPMNLYTQGGLRVS